ncbi:MAG: hypothetical protein U5O39_07115 [Gammaproteobacteria bacterium]|nr:hypothetical protein [Gammaproteobacteria bacterium]
MSGSWNAAFRIYLLLVALANVVGIAGLAFNYDGLAAAFPGLNLAFAAVLIVMGIASLFAIVLIWLWKVSGLVILGFTYLVILLINLAFEAPMAITLSVPLAYLVLLALVWPNRERFRTN